MKNIKLAKRSGTAIAAMHRKAGPMKHRLSVRGGANKAEIQAEILSHWDDMDGWENYDY